MTSKNQTPSLPPPIEPGRLAEEEHRVRQAHYSKRTAENLVAFGLIDSPLPESSSKRRKKTVGFHFRHKENRPRQTPATSSQAPGLDQQSSSRLGSPIALGKRPRQLQSPPQSPLPNFSRLKELQHDEMFASRGVARRERSFKGMRCAACEEPLEHMLQGERILQLSCGHVSHEACFYEYIKEFREETCPDCNKPLGLDTSRGGNIDFENLNKLVRNIQTPDPGERPPDVLTTPPRRDDVASRAGSERAQPAPPVRSSRNHLLPDSVYQGHRGWQRNEGLHSRNASNATEDLPSHTFQKARLVDVPRHDIDTHSAEAPTSSPVNATRRSIPSPTVIVRSEFPTLSRARHSQSLTCLVTVEVAEGKWHPQPDDLNSAGTLPSPIAEEVPPDDSTLLVPSQSPPPVDSVYGDLTLDEAKEDLFARVDNWHGLDHGRFGKLLLHGTAHVGKDKQAWQELECYLFSEMLICVKERRVLCSPSVRSSNVHAAPTRSRLTLKGSILIKRHLRHVEALYDEDILSLSLSVAELPAFFLSFKDRRQLEAWQTALININIPGPPTPQNRDFDRDTYATDEQWHGRGAERRPPSAQSSISAAVQSNFSAHPDHACRPDSRDAHPRPYTMHIPLDIVVVVPVSSSTNGLKMNLMRDSLRFLIANLGEHDRLGLVTFGSGTGSAPVVGLTSKNWHGWPGTLDLLRPEMHKNLRADVVAGASVAMDLLMQRKTSNPLSHIVLISDSPTSDPDSVDFVVSRAEAAKIGIHSFGLGMTHKPDTMVEMATRTKASYTYVKDWMMLRECLAGCIGSLQSVSHQNVKLRLRLPEGSPAKFVKISGALQITKRSTGRDAEASLGDLRFGDKRNILVQLAVQPDSCRPDSVPSDPWESMISGLEALGTLDQEDQRAISVDEIPLLQADLTWGDVLREGNNAQLPRPSLLTITMLSPVAKKAQYGRPITPPIPPHPSIVQRRMELLTSDMLSRALGLVARGQNDRAHHLLAETRAILKGLGKGSVPPPPTPPPTAALPPTPQKAEMRTSPVEPPSIQPVPRTPISPRLVPDPLSPFTPAAGIDRTTLTALDSELEASLEWISHPAVFARDSRKAVLQAISVISSQRGYTFRTPAEALWATRIPGIRRLNEKSREWGEARDDSLTEEK